MTKKDYQALAGALFAERRYRGAEHVTFDDAIKAVADALAADNPRFDRATFVLACEDGNVGRQPRTVHKGLPLCVQAMKCYCAGHARGNPVSAPCDTRE